MVPGMWLDYNDGVIAADVGLIEYEGLLFGRCSFMFFVLQQRIV